MKRKQIGSTLVVALAFAAPLVAAPIVTVDFQQGAAGYTDTFDRKISPDGTADANGADVNTDIDGPDANTTIDNFFIDGGSSALNDNGARHGLLRFSNIVGGSGIPAGAKIIRARIDALTNLAPDAQTGDALNVYRLTTAFDGSSTWAAPFGGNGTIGDVGEILGSFDDMDVAGNPTSARVDRAVQAWVDGAPNLGFAIRSDRGTNAWSPHTTGSGTVANRPKLTVEYTTDPLVEVTSYQQGVNSYAGTVDLRFNSADGSATDGSTIVQEFLDGSDPALATPSPDQSTFLRFNGINLNYPALYRAELVIKSGLSSANADSPGPFHVHQILRDWNTSTTYASLDSNSDPAVNTSTELIAGGVIGPAAATVTGINDTEVMYVDVTSIVENWRLGQPNYGFYIGTPAAADGGTANGWQIFFSGATDLSFRPELRIIGVPEPAAAVLLVFAALTTLFLRRRGWACAF
jgi:hypothetical protein